MKPLDYKSLFEVVSIADASFLAYGNEATTGQRSATEVYRRFMRDGTIPLAVGSGRAHTTELHDLERRGLITVKGTTRSMRATFTSQAADAFCHGLGIDFDDVAKLARKLQRLTNSSTDEECLLKGTGLIHEGALAPKGAASGLTDRCNLVFCLFAPLMLRRIVQMAVDMDGIRYFRIRDEAGLVEWLSEPHPRPDDLPDEDPRAGDAYQSAMPFVSRRKLDNPNQLFHFLPACGVGEKTTVEQVMRWIA